MRARWMVLLGPILVVAAFIPPTLVNVNAAPVYAAHAATTTGLPCPRLNTPCTIAGQRPVTIIPISAEYQKQFAARHLGADVAAHMLHRVETQPSGAVTQNIGVVEYSYAWAGYVVDFSGTTTSATAVEGQFNTNYPTGSCGPGGSNTCADMATWVGIGGYRSAHDPLIQAGMFFNQSDATQTAFWEIVPCAENGNNGCYYPLFDVTKTPAHQVYATVQLDPNYYCRYPTPAPSWYLLVQDLTTGTYGPSYEVCYNTDESTVEWSEENYNGGIMYPAAKLPNVDMRSANWSNQSLGSWQPISSSYAGQIRILRLYSITGPTRCIKPTSLYDNGTYFTMYTTDTPC